ncbi:MAG: hypothetical protein LAP39_22620 [Acidobacteriia bacterium]|nr:hypothetical protein [Terriglobia bacterium]
MNKEIIEPVSFSLDLLNLSHQLGCSDCESGITPDAIEEVEDALRAAGVRVPVKKTK